jgi:crotonobetaine/carnitine-CoA ligase
MNSTVGNRTLSTFLEFHAVTLPHEVALFAETQAGVRQMLTWSELNASANQTGRWILEQGLKQGDSIALCLPNCLELYLLWLAAAKTGTVAVPIDPGSTPPELEFIIEHSDARLVLALTAGMDAARSATRRCSLVKRLVGVSLTEPLPATELGGEINKHSAEQPSFNVKPVDVAGMLYTSGTTGRPKGVMLTHAAYIYGAEVFARSTALTPRDRHLIALPLYHAAAQCHALTPSLVAGASVAIVERFSASRFLQQAIRYGATRAALFAAPLRMLLRQYMGSRPPKTPLRLVTFAQNLVPEELREWDERFGIPLMQLWGMTETVGLPLMVPLNGPRDNMSMGLPVPGYEVKIVDATGQELPAGAEGEIAVRAEPGWNVTSGYYKNPQATAELIREGWIHSGDRGRVDEKGQFHFLGRFKEMIKRAGENISPLEVEGVLATHSAVADAAVVGVPDPLRDERVVAFVVFKEGQATSPDELKQWCRQALSAFKVPEEFVVCEEFPRTSVGKVQRHLLRRALLERSGQPA